MARDLLLGQRDEARGRSASPEISDVARGRTDGEDGKVDAKTVKSGRKMRAVLFVFFSAALSLSSAVEVRGGDNSKFPSKILGLVRMPGMFLFNFSVSLGKLGAHIVPLKKTRTKMK